MMVKYLGQIGSSSFCNFMRQFARMTPLATNLFSHFSVFKKLRSETSDSGSMMVAPQTGSSPISNLIRQFAMLCVQQEAKLFQSVDYQSSFRSDLYMLQVFASKFLDCAVLNIFIAKNGGYK